MRAPHDPDPGRRGGRPPTPATARSGAQAARAYSGAAHRLCWFLPSEEEAPLAVDLGTDGPTQRYRLVHHPRTRRPARDHLGNLVYMPIHHLPAAGGAAATEVQGQRNGTPFSAGTVDVLFDPLDEGQRRRRPAPDRSLTMATNAPESAGNPS